MSELITPDKENQSKVDSLPSIHHLEPLESGGPIARKGFEFQDHVAAGFCLQMYADSTLKEVWCETIDDVVLLWQDGAREIVEFVQVKSDEPDQLWSIAMLCENNGGKTSSILEKNLNHARCKEECRFKIVTSREVKKELELLKTDITSSLREIENAEFKELLKNVTEKIGKITSEGGYDIKKWLSHCIWEVKGETVHIENANKLLLRKIIETSGQILFSDQLDELYLKILQMVKNAALAQWKIDKEAKKIRRDCFCDSLKKTVAETIHPTSAGGGKKLKEKMENANLHDYVETAIDLRRRYIQQLLDSKYLDLTNKELVVGEVQAKMNHLKAQLDKGLLSGDQKAFHEMCLQSLEDLRLNMSCINPSSAFLQGCMYDLTDRCVHRFSEPKP